MMTSDFSNPVYKMISLQNGEINKMKMDDIQRKLAELKMDERGSKEILKKRLKHFYKRMKLEKLKGGTHPYALHHEVFYDYLCVIDYEATCESTNKPSYKHEIIEFPIVLVNVKTLEIEDEFHAFVRPVLHPVLSEFCTELTGITQEQVSVADYFPAVLKRVNSWMLQHGLGVGADFAIVTDGPWDMARFLRGQCELSQISYPTWAKKWINIRKTFGNFYGVSRVRMTTMLDLLGLQLEGRHHSGLDDSRNIAHVLLIMLRDGAEVRVNERLHPGNIPSDDLQFRLTLPVSRNEAEGSSNESEAADDVNDIMEGLDLTSSFAQCSIVNNVR
ncbi:PREDICTED: 3'-5' exoribonuclease 1-like [Priapulus caudatus]|uniref:3'-5' exoribonuclease 1-like n=1 Tax=Priapulus caudatus TaxID=37621 RepID=A0ABM1DS62_PRICU|nr:PREDICTED: 3'-5' exoribonuclease 1-like [Priapulus caudatus]